MAMPLMTSPDVKRGTEGDADFAKTHQKLIDTITKISNHCAQTGTIYKDIEFPVIPEESTEIKNRIHHWLRPGDIIETRNDDVYDWSLFNDPCCSDVLQGTISNCWLVSIMSTIAEKQFLLDRIFPSKELNKYGAYGVRLCLDGEWKDIIIDDRLPCSSKNQLCFAKAKRKQLWVPLLEKAVAKLLGGYTKLLYRTSVEGMALLTGCAVESHFTDISFYNEASKKELWERLELAVRDGFLMISSTGSKIGLQSVQIAPNHAYSFLAIAKIGNIKLFLLRNIWGKRSFIGDWSENSEKWNDIPEELIPSEGKGNSAEGVFWISMEDFARYFDFLVICIARENYHEYFVKGKLYQERDESWDAFEFEVLDNSQVDINLQPVSRNFIAGAHSYKLVPVTMAIFDQYWGLVGFKILCDIYWASWRSKFLAQGKYRVYITAFNSLLKKERTKLIFVCHSSKKVKCREYRESPTNIAYVLLVLAICQGERLYSNLGDDSVEIYLLRRSSTGGRGIAIVNRNPTKTVFITTSYKVESGIHSTRSTTTENTLDAIPPNCSQIVQFLLPNGETDALDSLKPDFILAWATPEQLVGNTVIQRPTLTFANHVIHRLVRT